jgi:hypothetical protein
MHLNCTCVAYLGAQFMRSIVSILFLPFITAGCATTPSFDKITGVTPKTIVDTLECEIIAAKKKNAINVARDLNLIRMGRLPKTYPIRDLKDYVAVAELTLQVDAQATLIPSFTQTDIISKTFTRAFDYGVKLDSQSHRVYSETINFSVAAMSDSKNSCEQRRAGISLNGKLGVEEVVNMAFGSIDPEDQGIDLPMEAVESAPSGRTGGSKGAFGTSLEFDLVGAITASGPTFTLVHFRGPGKLFATQRSDTHKITISFASIKKGGGTARAMDNARIQNLLINNETLPAAISRKLQQLQ